jgi:hypothetical protein
VRPPPEALSGKKPVPEKRHGQEEV